MGDPYAQNGAERENRKRPTPNAMNNSHVGTPRVERASSQLRMGTDAAPLRRRAQRERNGRLNKGLYGAYAA